MVGATGTIGRATVGALVAAGNEVVCFVRAGRPTPWAVGLPGVTVRTGDVANLASLREEGFRGERFDAVVSCMASRTGTPRDAWAVDHAAHLQLLAAAKEAGVRQMVLLSAEFC
jgi:divinyl chlorophyllide a 8-vinyl-reductase